MKALNKIIVTDDEKDILTIAKFTFEDLEGVQIKYCSSGQQTIHEALTFLPDLIILDIMMPEMDGISTFKAMKLIPSLSHIPVIFLTAKARKDEIEQYKHLGALGIITKPFDPLTLSKTVLDLWQKLPN